MPEQLNLNLPYAEIKGAATQKTLREHFVRAAEETYTIALNLILVREGFNQRRVYVNIPELADQLFQHGQTDAVWLNIEPDGKAYVIRGHRRLKAFKLLVEIGAIPEDFPVKFIPKKMTELEMFLDQELSNSGEKMTPLERSGIAFGLKHNFGKEMTHEEIAKLMCISRQQVDNLIILASADDLLKDQILKEEINVTDAIALLKNEKKLKRQADKKENDAGQSSMYETPLPHDPNAEELAISKELEDTLIISEDDIVANESDEVRTTNPEVVPHESKPLDLVGNSVADKKESKKENDGTVKYDMDREEIVFCQNVIKNLDRLESIVTKLDVPDGSKKDVGDLVRWIQKDMDAIRLWVHKNKKQNKAR